MTANQPPKNTKPVASRTQNTGAAKSGDGKFTVDPAKNQPGNPIPVTVRAPGTLAGYEIRNLETWEERLGIGFAAEIWRDGRHVLSFENKDGRGANIYFGAEDTDNWYDEVLTLERVSGSAYNCEPGSGSADHFVSLLEHIAEVDAAPDRAAGLAQHLADYAEWYDDRTIELLSNPDSFTV